MASGNRFSNGWQLAKTSFRVLNANKELIVFPILSGIAILAIIATFAISAFDISGSRLFKIESLPQWSYYLILFLFYIVTYFIVVFFNMGLMHCVKLYFDGKEVSVNEGLRFSFSRTGAIFSWAVFAATVGLLLKMSQERFGWIGNIIGGIAGIAWSVATYFVIPVIAYEDVGPTEAVQRSASIMKEKWGEGIGANFSFGLIGLLFFALFAIVSMGVAQLVNEQAGVVIFVLAFLVFITIMSALHSIFIMALYNHVRGNSNDHFDRDMFANLFVEK